jgi:protein TonB
MQKPLIFGLIVLVHALAVLGIAQVRPHLDPSLQEPLTVRLISEPHERTEAKPIEVKTIAPNITIQPPETLVFELPPVVEQSARAITIPVRAAVPVAAMEDRNVPKLISTVEYLREPAPRYPPQSRKLREQGIVMLRVMIDEKGIACSIEIESSSGHARLDHAAREAVSRAAFRPYVEDGAPRRAMVLIPIEFSLSRSSA